MPNILLEIAYNGKDFYGWQYQPDKISIQEVITKSLKKMFPKEDIKLLVAGRTDAGVNANGQIASFKVNELFFDLEKLKHFLNRMVGKYIWIKDVRIVADDFHATFMAKKRIYCYRISKEKKVFVYNIYHEPYYDKLDINLLKDYMDVIRGEHNFLSFSNSNLNTKYFVCNMMRTELIINQEEDIIEFWFEANRFLYNMIRNLVGTMLYMSRNRLDREKFVEVLESRDRKNPGGRVAPCGLTLEKVVY